MDGSVENGICLASLIEVMIEHSFIQGEREIDGSIPRITE